MGKGIIGKKIGMTQVFKDNGEVVPVTVIKAGPCVVVQKKNKEIDGYNAIQLGFEDVSEYKANKPRKGHFGKAGVGPKKYLQEFKNLPEDFNIGDEVKADLFAEGDSVDVSGISKGKGFAGNIKRWNHARGPMSHGSHFHRAPGSIGSVDAARVFKGQKLPGRMGGEKVTIQNLEVVRVDSENNLLLIKGSVPGAKNCLLKVQGSIKAKA